MTVHDHQGKLASRCAALGLSLAQAHALAASAGQAISCILGLDPETLHPLKSRPWLWMAAQTCSVSYRSPITQKQLLEILTTGTVPPAATAPICHFVDEAPIQIVVMAVEEASQLSGLDILLIWSNVDKIARSLSSNRLLLAAK